MTKLDMITDSIFKGLIKELHNNKNAIQLNLIKNVDSTTHLIKINNFSEHTIKIYDNLNIKVSSDYEISHIEWILYNNDLDSNKMKSNLKMLYDEDKDDDYNIPFIAIMIIDIIIAMYYSYFDDRSDLTQVVNILQNLSRFIDDVNNKELFNIMIQKKFNLQ